MNKFTEGPWTVSDDHEGGEMKPGTPLPWYTASTGNHQTLVISEHDGQNVAVAYFGEPDAAYIAHACNLYPELVKELRDLVQAIYAEVPDTDDMEKTQPDLYIECGTAEQLLAKCEEE